MWINYFLYTRNNTVWLGWEKTYVRPDNNNNNNSNNNKSKSRDWTNQYNTMRIVVFLQNNSDNTLNLYGRELLNFSHLEVTEISLKTSTLITSNFNKF
jgi:hypothetical protein